MTNRINRAVELLAQNQPIFYLGGHTGFALTHEHGKEMAGTAADYINIGMEHGAFDMAGLDAFMNGLVDGGPTASGHRTPTVIVEAPVDGGSEDTIRHNAWQLRQILARGVHGILLCHAENPGAVKAFIESCRYPSASAGRGHGLDVGRRGVGGEAGCAPIWGLENREYIEKADPWPLNPEGELMLGLKIENLRALNTVESTLAVPGIAFAEWGPGDMAMSMGIGTTPGAPRPERLQAARDRVLAACLANGVAFLEGPEKGRVVEQYKEGVRIGGYDEALSKTARDHVGRTMPV
jgi:4-hydroxy-2-oxoheptanedioate aldolase